MRRFDLYDHALDYPIFLCAETDYGILCPDRNQGIEFYNIKFQIANDKSISNTKIQKCLQRMENKKINIDVEWYSGKEVNTHPMRVKVAGVWEEVFQYEKEIHEDLKTKQRKIIFYCHIGDNRIVKIERLNK